MASPFSRSIFGQLNQGYELGRQSATQQALREEQIRALRDQLEDYARQRAGEAAGYRSYRDIEGLGGLGGMGSAPATQPPRTQAPGGLPQQQQPTPPQLVPRGAEMPTDFPIDLSQLPQRTAPGTGPLLDPGRQLIPAPGGGRAGRVSWFGNQPGWVDPMSGPRTASGRPLSEPGIALPDRATLGQMFDVNLAGRAARLPQTDVGPAAWTGRGIDINSAAAQQMGFTDKTFPTDAVATVTPAEQVAQTLAGADTPAAQQTAQMIGERAAPYAGKLSTQGMAAAIERTNPNAPDGVKAAALIYLNKLLAPEARADLALQLQQMKSDARFEALERRAAERESQLGSRLGQQRELADQRLQQQREMFEARQAGRGSLFPATEIEVKEPGAKDVKRYSVRQHSQEPGYFDANTGKRIDIPEGSDIRQIQKSELGGGGREAAQTQRQLVAAREIMSDLQNVVALPTTVTGGLFQGRQQGPSLFAALKEDLAQHITSEDAQLANSALSGIERELSIVVSPVYGGRWAAEQFGKLALREGMTLDTKMYNIARIRQTVDNSLEAVSKSPRLGAEQKEFAQYMRDEMAKAVPWTPADVLAFSKGARKGETFLQFSQRRGVSGAAERGGGATTPATGATGLPPASEMQGLSNDEILKRLGIK